ncbi:Uncharacterized membrane protein YeaQ/YmgE, transglycosylase-associated protein family [Cruoricaptor ignavus]|uniref:GlsB/YeaQ/YmgE family stress response membrane protein n=1 Tax=Cruoricaptor ignavus TaxID=1118202 RepID=A0A1M6A4F0_9FLAO|nr:GlsB/YeaQ/YmgE family stress response membrane protein [Cruoricaptor ignavus]QOR74695.1 GlsB/YeaQ/YmgE family stress response membrane protein [Cruoricaptor ignavus]SHI31340.1 Uncharacterized membrane protein YeaQ/YmgE, transglycosylase-associated protein family [Cruoricaptor ignavus]
MIGGILSWIIFGAIIGALAKMIMPGNQAMGWPMTIILGIVGSMVGGWIGDLLFGGGGANDYSKYNIGSIVLSIVGALIVLWAVGAATRRR